MNGKRKKHNLLILYKSKRRFLYTETSVKKKKLQYFQKALAFYAKKW